jgi:hypothetical protein
MSNTSEFKKPINLISIGLGILSIILSIIFYVDSLKQKSISYRINSPASIVYDSKNSSAAFKLYNRDSTLINENVYLLSGTIWNSGDIEVKKEEVRRQLAIFLGNSTKLLDFKIIKQKDSIANFSMIKKESNLLQIDWDYFDPGFGFNFQIIYTGDINPDIKFRGIFLGISEINEIKPYNKTHKLWNLTFILQIINLITLPLIIYRERKERKFEFWLSLFLFCSQVYLVFSHLYNFFFEEVFKI